MTKTVASEKNKIQDSKKLTARFPIRLFAEEDSSEAQIPSRLHVIPTGMWDHNVYGEMKIDESHIAEFVRNFKAGVRKEIPITAGHEVAGELPAVGWFKELIDEGKKGLYAIVEWTEEGRKMLKQRAFKYFSPEYYPFYEDPTTGRTYKNVLVGGALTNKPFFKELEDVAIFSEPKIINQFNEEEIMDIKVILAKAPETLTNEEKDFLRQNAEQLSEEEKETFADALKVEDAPEDGKGEEEGAGEEAGADEGTPENGEEGEGKEDPVAPVEASEPKMVTMSEVEALSLKDKANKGFQAFQELEKMKIDKKVEALVFSEGNKSGHILPAHKGAVEKFMITLSETQRDQFVNIINKIPKPDLFNEVGDGGGNPAKAQEVIDAKVAEKIKASEGKILYAVALSEVLRENPELSKRRAEEMNATQA